MPDRIEVSVVAFQQGDQWVAQCVEYDIAAFAKSLPEVMRKFEKTMMANVCANVDLGRQGLQGIPQAPERYRALFDQSELGLKSRKKGTDATSRAVKIRDLRVAEAA